MGNKILFSDTDDDDDDGGDGDGDDGNDAAGVRRARGSTDYNEETTPARCPISTRPSRSRERPGGSTSWSAPEPGPGWP